MSVNTLVAIMKTSQFKRIFWKRKNNPNGFDFGVAADTDCDQRDKEKKISTATWTNQSHRIMSCWLQPQHTALVCSKHDMRRQHPTHFHYSRLWRAPLESCYGTSNDENAKEMDEERWEEYFLSKDSGGGGRLITEADSVLIRDANVFWVKVWCSPH